MCLPRHEKTMPKNDHSTHILYNKSTPLTYVRLKSVSSGIYQYSSSLTDGLTCFGLGVTKKEAVQKMINSARQELNAIEEAANIYFSKEK